MTKIIDKRKKEDVFIELQKLAESYIPEWKYDKDNPDIAATLGYVYSEQISENIDKINNIIERYHTEFVNLLDISVKPAKPAQSIVVMELAQDTVDGVEILAGTKLAANGGAATAIGEDIIFETKYNSYVTSAAISKAYLTDFEDGSIMPILGQFEVPSILNSVQKNDDDETVAIENEDDNPEEINQFSADSTMRPFVLFGEGKGVESNALIFYHPYILDNNQANIYVQIKDSEALIQDLLEGRKKFFYATKGTLKEVEELRRVGADCFEICMEGKQDLQRLEDETTNLIAIVDSNPVLKKQYANSIRFKSLGQKKTAEYVGNGITDLDTIDFFPFTEYMSLYQECFIGDNSYFSKFGSKITMEFDLLFEERRQNLTASEEEEELKIIKRKPRDIVNTVPAEVFAQEISIEYYNGFGYRKLHCDSETRFIFAEEKACRCEISFTCPDDWADSTVGGYDGKLLRMQLLRADNCYMRPSIHHSPRIRNLSLSFNYESFMNPQRIFSIFGTQKIDISANMQKGEPLEIFRPTGYEQDALYLGLNKRPEKGPVSMLFRMEEMARYEPLDVYFEYSTHEGFKRLKVVDDTYSMSRSGLVTFMPPVDFVSVELEKSRLFWIRVIRRRRQNYNENNLNLPHIVDICMNGVAVHNVDTRPEEQFYLEEATPYARFSLALEGILRCDVWVNEIDTLTESKMKEIKAAYPDRVRVEYDIHEKVTAFYVKWTEVERFDTATDRRVYVLDRMSKEIIFGDGITTDIPRTISDTALRVVPYISNGNTGNVDPRAIDTPMSALYFIGEMSNPIKGYGGSNMESMDDAMVRGANIISGRRHLVSLKDFEREILSFSDLIDQVKVIGGYDAEGFPEPGALTFLLMMNDYRQGSYSIHQMESELKKHLLKSCELTVPENKLYVTEPIYVEISVIAWVKAAKMQDSFQITSDLEKSLDSYLDPLSSSVKFWSIGDIPSVSQILMWINTNKGDAVVQNVAIIAKYRDHYGMHEIHLDELKATPYMVGVPGNHQIHIEV